MDERYLIGGFIGQSPSPEAGTFLANGGKPYLAPIFQWGAWSDWYNHVMKIMA